MNYLALIFVLCFPVSAIADNIIVLGDSLSAAYRLQQQQGWVHQLRERLAEEDYKIINESISGETSSGLLHRLPSYLQNRMIDYAIVEIGINDAFANTPLDLIEDNLDSIITTLKQRNCKVLLIEMQQPLSDNTSYKTQFRELYKAIAEKHNIELAPFLLRDIIHTKNHMMDMIHPNAAGQEKVLITLWPSIQKFLSRDGK